MNPLMLASENTAMLAIIGGFVIAATAIVAGTIRKVYQSNEREESRREIAAYVAEGSMTADEGERLMNAGSGKKSCE